MHCSALSNKLNKQFKGIINTQKRIERLSLHSVSIPKKDLIVLYDGLFLKLITQFESFVEELFIGLLYDKHTLSTRKKVQKVIFPDRKTTLNYLYYGKKYVDLMPHDKLLNAARVFFNDDNPFNTLSSSDKDTLKEIFIIRNAIAHKSDFSDKKFKELMNDKGFSVLTSPSEYLRTLHSPSITMFNQYTISLAHIANKFTSFT